MDNTVVKRLVMTSAFTGAFFAVPLVGEAALGDMTLKQGITHTDVKQLQSLLKQKGYFKEQQTTTYFGPITKKAVMDFQKANGLVVDGIVGKRTYSKLLEKSFQETPPKKQPAQIVAPASKDLKLHSTGQAVMKLQQDLKYLGFFTYYKTTDYYGTITTEAVRKFQLSQKLKATGVADVTTLDRVAKAVAAKKNPVQPPAQTKPAAPAAPKPATPSKPTPPPAPPKPAPAPQPPQSTVKELKFGSTGPEVKQLQTRLKNLGFFTYPMITDYFGMVTEESVEKFQKAYGLPVTGIVTKAVLDKMSAVEKQKTEKPQTHDQITINVIANAAELMGTPYVWGGATTKGFDCSGFIQYIYSKAGVSLPRTVAQMWNATNMVSKPSVGDLVFFETYTTGPSHAGIYIGNNQFVHAGSSTGVTISNLNTAYWQNIYLGAKRIND
ncbi:peptidoglycan-binding protein [Fictibacillus phosphorivorans]|uniref:C40 family peptidase n=1 Tax=Fictibacillus phosphorivorans TaxID=1221500 RepID=UPI00203ABBB9|nr:peptidoglycan-binding protein [Fictibacillus phosphorivorans]MCM3718552.1 peptidoglycan-binding protein [Fictibacillus phosphorivorans]MCM3776092.1 peptidoglycan-binding protein [Fictibacillus phosphorivorans]